MFKEIELHRSRGAPPSFNEIDLLRAVYIIGLENKISRLKLALELELGEGSVRGLLSELMQRGLVKTSRQGNFLTSTSLEKFRKLTEKIVKFAEISGDKLTFGKDAYAILVKNSGGIGSGIAQRDAALKQGCDGATILVVKEKNFLFPDKTPSEEFLGEKTRKEIEGKLNPKNGDAIILCYGGTGLSKKRGAWAAALSLRS